MSGENARGRDVHVTATDQRDEALAHGLFVSPLSSESLDTVKTPVLVLRMAVIFVLGHFGLGGHIRRADVSLWLYLLVCLDLVGVQYWLTGSFGGARYTIILSASLMCPRPAFLLVIRGRAYGQLRRCVRHG